MEERSADVANIRVPDGKYVAICVQDFLASRLGIAAVRTGAQFVVGRAVGDVTTLGALIAPNIVACSSLSCLRKWEAL